MWQRCPNGTEGNTEARLDLVAQQLDRAAAELIPHTNTHSIWENVSVAVS